MDNDTGGVFTAVVNHLKSKGSDCDDLAITDLVTEQGSCNLTRTLACGGLVDWLATDPTNSGDPDFLIIGDLNSYDKEDPIDAILAAATPIWFTSTWAKMPTLTSLMDSWATSTMRWQMAIWLHEVTGVTIWHINADEPSLIDYDMSYKQDAQDAIYAPDAYRSSDHDPVIVGLELTTEAEVT